MKIAVISFLDFIDSRAVIRRIVLGFTLYMTWLVTHQAWAFAHTSTFDGMGTAAVIAAIMAPTAALQGFAFSTYAKGRSE
jgi:flagellar biosynthesis protein FliR